MPMSNQHYRSYSHAHHMSFEHFPKICKNISYVLATGNSDCLVQKMSIMAEKILHRGIINCVILLQTLSVPWADAKALQYWCHRNLIEWLNIDNIFSICAISSSKFSSTYGAMFS